MEAEIIALLKSLVSSLKPGPSLLWGQLMTLVVTWGAVYFTNKTNKNLMTKQLEHASDEKDKEREMGLRREVYLPAIEAISEARFLLVMCADVNAPDSKIVEQQQELDAAVGKIILIGSNETTKSVTEFSTKLTVRFLQLYPKRSPLIETHKEIVRIKQMINGYVEEKRSFNQMLRKLHIEGSNDKHKGMTVLQYLEFTEENIKECNNRIKKLEDSKSKYFNEYLKECMNATKEISKYAVMAIRRMKEELRLSDDIDEFHRFMNQQDEIIAEEFDRYMSSLQ